jgi:hypothetical protein
MKKIHVGTIESDPRDLTKNRGHDYGVGRTAKVHRHKNEKRAKQKLKKQLEW